jgi:hypothetical protein
MAPLARRAIWLIVLSWLLFVLATLVAWDSFMVDGLWAAYHPGHLDIPIVRTETGVALAAMAIGLLGSMFATAAIERGARMAAATIVVACWSTVLLGGALAIGLTASGPLTYNRYAGDQLFRVPWQYHPRGADSPSKAGFFTSMCLESLRGVYDDDCRNTANVTVRESGSGFDTWDERIWQWRSKLSQVAFQGERHGYRISDTPDARYFRRSDADGSLNAMVICDGAVCRRQFLSGTIIIDYTLPRSGETEQSATSDAKIERWDAVDCKLAALVDGWKAR